VIPDPTVVAEYADNMSIYTRKMFDPFRRGDQYVLECGDARLSTTVGQMNFFRWFIESGLWQKVNLNQGELAARMAAHAEVKALKGARQSTKADLQPRDSAPHVYTSMLVFD
jgi:hypothetical protein